MSEKTRTGGSNSELSPLTAPGGLLSDENLPKLAKRAARHAKRPRGVDLQDAEQDAAVELLGYRRTFDLARCAHLDRMRQERLIVAWTRLRLTSLYDSRIAEAVLTQTVGDEGGFGGSIARSVRPDDPDALDLDAIVRALPPRQRAVMIGVFYDGKEQREIARELSLSQTVISREYNAAKEAIREALLCAP